MPDDATRDDENRALDAVLGVVARSVRATAKVASTGERVAQAIGSTAIGRAASGTARRALEPLARDGAEVRHQMGEDLPVLAKDFSARVTPAVVEAVDPDALIGTIDLDGLLEHIDMDRLLARIDVDGIIQRVDIGAVLKRIDLNEVMGQIDLNALLEQVDLNALMERIDLDSLVSRTEIGSLVAKSTSGIASDALDVVRRQGVGLDNFLGKWVDKILRRDPSERLAGPPLLVQSFAGELGAPAEATA